MWKLKKKDADSGPMEIAGGRKETWKEKRARKKKNAKGGKWIFLLVLALAAIIGGSLFWQNHSRKVKLASATAEAKNTAVVTKGNLVSELSSSGTISPKDTYSITSLVEGDVITADFEEGDQVTKDQVLYQIDVSSMESEVQSANNSLERASNSYQQAVKDYQEALNDYSGNTYKSTRSGFVQTLNIQVGDKISANTELAVIYNDQTMKIKVPFLSGEAPQIGAGSQAVITLSDTEEQLSGVVTSVSNMDEVLDGGRLVRYVTIEVANPGGLTTEHSGIAAIGEFTSAVEGSFEPTTNTTMKADISGNAEVETLLIHEGDYVTAGTPIFQMKASDAEDIIRTYKDAMDSAQEKVESAQSKVDTTQDTYENYTITAPISGQVITKSVKAGDKISKNSSSGATTLAVIYDLSEVTFEMSVDELDVQKVKVGQKVEVTADAIENKTFSGTVTNISLESAQSNGVTNYPVTVTLDEVGDLLPGMNVDGKITLEQADDALMIPVDSLMRGNKVYVKDDSVTEKQGAVPAGFRAADVETGVTSDEYVQIVSGLSEGDVIYVSESSKNTETMMMPMGEMGGQGGNRGGNGQGGGRSGSGGGQGGPR